MTSRGLIWVLLFVTAAALALRLPQLDRRPLHTDESVHTIKFQGLWDHGTYRYDPEEYHGPSLYYFTLPFVWASGARTFADSSIVPYRLVPVFFGVVLIPLLWLARDALGKVATVAAAVFLAVSPSFAFYSRYYIHELILVAATWLAMAAGWRYARTPRAKWAAVVGVGVGLMYASKETFVLNLAAAAAGLALAWFWGMTMEGFSLGWRERLRPRHLALAGAVALGLGAIFFTSFFTNARGPLDSLRTYAPWFQRAHRASGFTPAEIKDLPRLASALKSGTNGVCQWLRGQLSETSRAALARYQGELPAPTALAQTVAEDFTRLLAGPSIYDPTRFEGVGRRVETRKLLARRTTAADWPRLNRLLLEDAFPVEIARSVQSPHMHPWYYYLDLAYFTSYFSQASESLSPHRWRTALPWWGRRVVWTEGFILLLAALGLYAALRRLPISEEVPSPDGASVDEALEDQPNPVWRRFLAFYTLALTLAYSLIH